MTDIPRLVPSLPRDPDGFHVAIDAARERGDIILDRPPLNIITMLQREQLRVAFEALDADPTVRIIVLRAMGEHFSSGGEIRGFLEASPEHVSRLAWKLPPASSTGCAPKARFARDSPLERDEFELPVPRQTG
jgi:2-oxoglutaroyl-CoA hydrolase